MHSKICVQVPSMLEVEHQKPGGTLQPFRHP